MIGSSPSNFIPGNRVLNCKSKDGFVLEKGDVVYILQEDKYKPISVEIYSVDELLADSRIKITQLKVLTNQKIQQTLPSSRVVVNILDLIKGRFAEVKFQLEVELPNKQKQLKELASQLNPAYELDVVVGSSIDNMEI